jgi:hypothetical protein
MHKAIIFLIFCWSANAEELRFAGPISGFVYDAPSRSVRVIEGIPGSSYLGTTVFQNIDLASIAPNGRSALLWADGKAFFVPRLDEEAAAREIGEAGVPDMIAWAPDSRAAVLYRSAESRLERWRNLDREPAIESLDELRPEGRLSFVAIDSSASRIAWASESGMFLWNDGAAPQTVRDAGLATAAIFSQDGKTLFMAAPGRIVALRNLDSGAYTDSLGQPDAALDPAGLALGHDGRLYVADRSTRSVLVYDAANGMATDRVALDSEPSVITALLRPGTFLLCARSSASDPVWVLETRTRYAAYFVGRGVE